MGMVGHLRERGSSWPRSGRRQWRAALDDDDVDLTDIKPALRELEDTVHALQEEADVLREEKFRDSGHPWVGKSARRFFNGRSSDGVISKWLPARDDEPPLWHMEHRDGDAEDLEEAEAALAIKYFETGATEPDNVAEADLAGDSREWRDRGPHVGKTVRRFYTNPSPNPNRPGGSTRVAEPRPAKSSLFR